MLSSFKIAMLEEIEQKIMNAHYVINDDNALLCYSMGIKFKYVFLSKPVEIGEHFKQLRVIDWYKIVGDKLYMYKLTAIKTGSEEIQRDCRVTLKDIEHELTPIVALTHAAMYEVPVRDRFDAIAWYFIKQSYNVCRHILSIRMII